MTKGQGAKVRRDPKTGMVVAGHLARGLAAEGRLVATIYDMFQKAVYPGAPQDQVDIMRICFFAGAQEIFALTMAAMGEGDDVTDADMAFMEQWTGELQRFHAETLDAMKAGGDPQ